MTNCFPAGVINEWSAHVWIKAYARSSSRDSILAFGNPGSASDEHRTVQARNCATGIAMPLIKKIDVENYRATRSHKGVRPDTSARLPDASGISSSGSGATATAPDPTKPNLLRPSPSGFAKDFLAEHSFSEMAVFSANHPADSAGSQAPATSKSAQT